MPITPINHILGHLLSKSELKKEERWVEVGGGRGKRGEGTLTTTEQDSKFSNKTLNIDNDRTIIAMTHRNNLAVKKSQFVCVCVRARALFQFKTQD